MKNTKKILAVLLAVLMIATLFAGCAKEEAHDHDHEAEVETESEVTAEPAELALAHHVNAYGLQSYSIHFNFADETFDYMNEAGELVSVSKEEVEAYLDQLVATCGDYTLDNRGLMLCYQEQYYQFYQVYGMYMMLLMDTSKGMDEQVGTDGVNTWQYMFVQAAAEMFHRMAAFIQEAEAQGFDTTEAMKKVEEGRKAMEDQAATVGYENVDEFIAASIAPGITLDDYMEFFQMQTIFNAYADYLVSQETATDEEVEAYYAENEESLSSSYPKIDKNVVDVRHILISPEETTDEEGNTTVTDAAWAEAEAKANRIYELWLSGDASEESFAAMVPAHTQDPGSAETGGLYEDVYPGQMVTEFNDWCFADGRKVGDHGVVKTDYGYHIMFFSGEGDYVYWQKSVADMVVRQRVNDEMTNIQAKYPMEADLTKAVILDKTAPTVPTAEEEVVEEEHVHTEDDGHNH